MILTLTFFQNLFVSFQWMDNAWRGIAETEAVDAMWQVQWDFIKEICDVNVSTGKVNTFASCYVKIASDFVER